MHINKSGKYVLYQNEICRLVSIGCVDDDDDLKEGFYIIIKNDKLINSECIEWLGKKIKPVNLKEIDNLYEIRHYVVCNGRKYKWYHFKKKENIIQVDADEYEDVDTRYKYVIHDRDAFFLEVPIDEVTLYETKTYYDKDKYINENERVVLSEETYLIDEPNWAEE